MKDTANAIWSEVRAVLEMARHKRQLPPNRDRDIGRKSSNAPSSTLAARPDTAVRKKFGEHISAVLRQARYQAESGNAQKMHGRTPRAAGSSPGALGRITALPTVGICASTGSIIWY